MNNVCEGKKYETFEVNYDVKIKCKKCGKSYTKCICCFEKEKITSRCPYCAEDNSVREQRSAQDIIDEVEVEQRDIPH